MMNTYRIRQAVQHAAIVPHRLVTFDKSGAVVGRCAVGELLHDLGYSDDDLVMYDRRNEQYPQYGAAVDELPGGVLNALHDAYGIDYQKLCRLQEVTDSLITSAATEAKGRALRWLDEQDALAQS